MDDEAAARVALLQGASAAAARVFTVLLTRGPISRIGIAKATGLSQAAVTKTVTPLVAAGLVDDRLGTQRAGQPGRPVSPIAVIPDALTAIGVKINVDEVIAVATDLRTGVLADERAPLRDRDPDAVVDAVAAIIATLETALGPAAARVAGIGVAVSGDVEAATGTVRESGLMGWTGVDLGERLHARLDAPVVVENDVRALTIGEHWFGIGLGTDSFAIVTIGRGIGSGLHVNGEVVEGAYGVAGEIGHLPLAAPDRICACGRRGCVEAVAASAAIADAVSKAHGRPVGIEEAARLAHDGDPAAAGAFGEAAAVIGTAIASLVNLAGPELVIIGGEGVADFDLFDAPLHAAFREHAFGAAGRCRIAVRPHTFEDWARGAAAAAIRTLVR
ncbi:Sugar kinase of the NBD/HSP70 family, may contain an N-terminal HTH domain [Glycomyces sambucus]|uniref:Sugar kinase of the NBD/HSP70 family, may contain an N-terminal HTH domain n=1 Tax=Glycomyces sambucus TaxID=380244 RepID=A0A1G9HXQ5_9ACTN|nr:ROK family transcriptional regulator [Glycomyces sambucus]SDL17632.1 Sugar kinase of the NBD/HSP70 family, may contain an N-terminal HTH domain [Glycomyces sambucus]